jgi:hypothetical protein
MTVIHPGGFEISRAHVDELRQLARQEVDDEQARLERLEAFAYRCATTAGQVRDEQAAAQADADRLAARLEADAERKRQERLAQADDYRIGLLASGKGRWRTVAEILDASRGVVPGG